MSPVMMQVDSLPLVRSQCCTVVSSVLGKADLKRVKILGSRSFWNESMQAFTHAMVSLMGACWVESSRRASRMGRKMGFIYIRWVMNKSIAISSKYSQFINLIQVQSAVGKMIKIKSDVNQKLLKNFSNQSFPDITIITATSKYCLTLAFLVIDSEYLNSLPPDTTEVDLSYLPEKPLVQVLRALYGDQLIVYSISELEMMYRVIDVLRIQEYRNSIVTQILKNKDLMENLEILEFCIKNGLIVREIKKIHIDHNLRALESNKNFLQLNKISLQTLIPLLLEYYQQVQEQGASVINNILQNYFNRNNLRPIQFFEKYDDVEILLNIWEQFHHILHIERKQHLQKIMMPTQEEEQLPDTKRIMSDREKSEHDSAKLREKDARINQLQVQIEGQNKIIEKLRKQLFLLKSEGGKIYSTKRIPSNPVLPYEEEDQISIIESSKLGKKDLVLKNVKSDYSHGQMGLKMDSKTPGRVIISHKPNFTDL